MDSKKDLKNILNDLESLKPAEEKFDKIKEMADQYSEKSEDEIVFEIINLNKKMEEEMDPEEYNAMLDKLDSIRPLLDEEQNRKLDMLLETIGKK
jgi:hypothetical protein